MVRVYSLLIISRNHSNTFVLLDLQKKLLGVYFNDVQINRWHMNLRSPFLQNTSRRLLLKFAEYLLLESFFVSLDKSVLHHRRCLMSKFTEMLILVCRKIFSAFYPILHESFSNSYGFTLLQEFNPFYPHLVFYDRKYFCSILTDLSNILFLFHQKFLLLGQGVKNVVSKQFPKMQKQPFANVLQKQSPRGVL